MGQILKQMQTTTLRTGIMAPLQARRKAAENYSAHSFGLARKTRFLAAVGVMVLQLIAAGGVAAQAPFTTKMTRKQLIDYAKHLVRECTTCHSLYGQDDGIPVMVGLSVTRFKDTLDLYRRGKRDNLVMVNVARSLNEQQTQALAIYLGSIPKPAAAGSKTRSAKLNSAPLGNDNWQPTWRHMTANKMKRANGWVGRGEAQLRIGRVNEARLWFERAAEYGIISAALQLGASYDPNLLQSGAGVGMEPDAAKARDWYIYARQLGSPVASKRLARLPAG